LSDSGSWERTKQVLTWLHLRDEPTQFCMWRPPQRVCHQAALSQQVMLNSRQESPLSNISHTTATRRSRPGYCSRSQSYSTTNPAADDERLQYINAQILDAGRRITQCEEIHRTNRSLENTEALLRAQRDKIMWTNKRNNADSMRNTPVTPLTTPSALDPLRWSRSRAPSSSIGILDPCQSRYSQSSTVPGVATQLHSLIWQVQIGLRPPCKALQDGHLAKPSRFVCRKLEI